jgi:hypothetical protein
VPGVAADEPNRPAIRVSDAERDAGVARLRDAAVDGRLTLEELANRTEAAYSATDRAQLEQLLTDLPAPVPASSQPPRRWFFGIMGGDTLRGPMRLAGECRIVNIMGGTDLDLSQATIQGGELTVQIISVMGGSTINVPHGVQVERTGFSLMGGDTVKAAEEPPPDAPVIRIRSFNLMGGSTIRRGKPRPSRWPWQRKAEPLPDPERRPPSLSDPDG